MNQPELEFPMFWEYKIIARQGEEALCAVREVLLSYGFAQEPRPGNVSRSGSYITYTVQMTMPSREHLDALTRALSDCEGVRYLL